MKHLSTFPIVPLLALIAFVGLIAVAMDRANDRADRHQRDCVVVGETERGERIYRCDGGAP